MYKYVRSLPKSTPAGVSWASWKMSCSIVRQIHHRALFSAVPSSWCAFVNTVICTPSSLSFFFAIDLCYICWFSKSPRSHSRPFTIIYIQCADTHNICSLVGAVGGGGQGLGLAKESAIGLNHLSSTMPNLMSSNHPPAALTSSAIELHSVRHKSGSSADFWLSIVCWCSLS
jgi:hypothetical protein